MNILAKTNKAERSMAVQMLQITTKRIFDDGKDANDSEIGTYSTPYLKTRIKNNYPNSRKVILQATTDMLDDFSVVTGRKSTGLGFKNSFNADKSVYVEETYDKPIFEHTQKERLLAGDIMQEEVNKIING